MHHVPVLLEETVAAVAVAHDGAFADATYGSGGHSRGLLERLGPAARLLVLDRDEDAVADARALAARDARVRARHAPFSRIGEVARDERLPPLNGVVMDIGVSSRQLDSAERGFSFLRDGPLDMRMDRKQGVTAAQWLNSADEPELAEVFRRYGEEPEARRIARAVIARRPLERTADLVAAVDAGRPGSRDGIHPATRVFQAIRIHVNDELDELDAGLDAAFAALAPGGRLAVITFHSLEHRMVRQRFRGWSQGEPLPRRLPTRGPARTSARMIVRRARPSAAEVAANPRARSAMLQVVEKTGEADA
ncbi:MAG: 16S rRNA (cytosine(1402)-N(4))-methyltransferase RsmH [Gammaproteobacteria bacterium]|nr:16S rRNA (cytosine(1402)-N(4))-methyltransferase RsmH [Gammaproteobacteria bacterium]